MGAGLDVKPNTINFATVFDNLGAKIVDNILVVLTVLVIIVAYIPTTVFLRRLDLADIVKVGRICNNNSNKKNVLFFSLVIVFIIFFLNQLSFKKCII